MAAPPGGEEEDSTLGVKICETGDSKILRRSGRELNKSVNGDFNESFGISAWIYDGHVCHKRFVGLERKN